MSHKPVCADCEYCLKIWTKEYFCSEPTVPQLGVFREQEACKEFKKR